MTNTYQARNEGILVGLEQLSLDINVGFDAYDLVLILCITHSSLGFTNKPFRSWVLLSIVIIQYN